MTTLFDPHELHALATGCLERPIDEILPLLHTRLRERYGKHIHPNPPWMFNNAGGAMGSMWVLHMSMTEYLIVFGSAIGTEGHTGRFLADDWFVILDGEQWAFDAGSLSRQEFKPGDMHHLPRGTARGYRIPDHCWALEYARGFIPGMLPFGLADGLSSTLDVRTLGQTIGHAAKSITGELLRGKL
ncbi:MAG: hypothetical protein IPH07_00115 [Deltaproteobacteria bacterium]|jgi:C-8 sterol isomerase|nr:hypothetical protein [Deltaproteobacteria bacterium]MBK8238599.1 hypothetical protein [Deltaproteobacteria bacterium]MBP7291607.1 hypothetical protein [Nannocystaceae bacterium]